MENGIFPYDILKLASGDQKNSFKFMTINFYYLIRKIFRDFLCTIYMIHNDTLFVPKNPQKYSCELCDYTTLNSKDFKKHTQTIKHRSVTDDTKMIQNDTLFVPKNPQKFICDCGSIYKYHSGFYRHKKVCKFIEPEQKYSDNTSVDKDDLIIMLLKQNSELLEIVKNGTGQVTHNNTNTNCMNNNKTFNLQFFLNETCKDAMNIMDFVESIKLQLSDLERVGEIGYVEGISNIITTKLKALDITQRPVHCTDKKRETMYIKDEDKWEKEDDSKSKLKKAIKKVANKNIKLLPQFREKHPDYGNSDSKISDKYSKTVIEAMGGSGDNDNEKEDKIIHNISKCTIIDKYS
jgi:hypothetical protein